MHQLFAKKLLLLFCSITFYGAAMAQSVTGKVTDQKGNPLSGVSVQVKNSLLGETTDTKGEFSINAPAGTILVFSYVGFNTQEVTVTGNFISVKLEESTGNVLSDVVIVGYGTQKKVNLTGAVSQITSKEIENRPVSNIGQALQGTIPNLNVTNNNGSPNSTPSLNVRGGTSFTNSGFQTGSPLPSLIISPWISAR